ncbi:hypothetical protein P154DRAFT_166788 [Amniculicola lignicola CBS 123094]|uniref:Ubiquitin 3 binding protein But2 C-terminal domain-containing protein n=1 Tax=Amniculicola lignicola CBS 123094 TaxID=1392246 RepID=A0A6A5WN86_9PLEO|nr:hypothetical protein P154DRAFT_166788 [Amniculicola lignicola CBS 123094]
MQTWLLPVLFFAFTTSQLTAACPYPNATLANSSTPVPTPPYNTTASSSPELVPDSSVAPPPVAPASSPPPACSSAYPTSLRQMRSQYPDQVYRSHYYFNIIRQIEDSFQIATQVQFTDLPGDAYNCRLQLVVPGPKTSRIGGPNPVVAIWNVVRAHGDAAAWRSFEGRNKSLDGMGIGVLEPWRTVNLTEVALQKNGPGNSIELGGMRCNGTLTWQMGMLSPGNENGTNAWDFLNVGPTATPIQGFRIVHSC